MTVAELIIELRKVDDQSLEVWIDTPVGLMESETLYTDPYGMGTVVLQYKDDNQGSTLIN
jgi:hypothetical protein